MDNVEICIRDLSSDWHWQRHHTMHLSVQMCPASWGILLDRMHSANRTLLACLDMNSICGTTAGPCIAHARLRHGSEDISKSRAF